VFLGYYIGYKGYVLLDIHITEIHISRNVSFHEHILPYPSNSSSITNNWDYFPLVSCPSSNSPLDTSNTPPSPRPPFIDPDPPHHDTTHSISPIPPPVLRKSTRSSHPLVHLQDYVYNISHASASSHVSYPIFDYISYTNLSPSHCDFPLSIASQTEPSTYVEASKFTCWKQAMQNEITALENTGTWKLVDLPPNVKLIGCIWIYKIKNNTYGSIKRYKARLVSKGYN